MTEPLTADPLTADEEAELRADIAEGPEGRAVQIYGEDVLRLLATVDEARATPRSDTRLREALTSWYSTAASAPWHLVAMTRAGGIVAPDIPEALLDAIDHDGPRYCPCTLDYESLAAEYQRAQRAATEAEDAALDAIEADR